MPETGSVKTEIGAEDIMIMHGTAILCGDFAKIPIGLTVTKPFSCNSADLICRRCQFNSPLNQPDPPAP
jgi:hypothetical protein